MFKTTFLLLLCCLSLLSGEVPAPTHAIWISYPEPAEENRGHDRYYRREFQVKDGLKSATLYLSIDDKGHALVNGHAIPNGFLPSVQRPRGFDVKGMLKPGANAVAVEMMNVQGIGGVIARLELLYVDGQEENVSTDLSWKCGRGKADGWDRAGFDETGWVAPMTYGDACVEPWHSLFPIDDLLTSGEKAAMQAIYNQRDAQSRAIVEKIQATETRPTVTIGYPNGRGHFIIDGRPVPAILYMTARHAAFDSQKYRDQARAFARGGTHLVGISFAAHDIWKADGSIDFGKIEHDLREYLLLDPEAYFSVAVSFEWTPKWWLDRHLDQCIDYAAEPGRRDTNEFAFNLAPSYASKVWIEDVKGVYARVVDFLEASPLGARVFSYRVDTGVYTEWHYYGLHASMPDCSRPMTDAFRGWLRRHYASDAALQAAWRQPGVTRDNALTPPKEVRTKYGAGQMRDPVSDRWTLDYLACHGEVCRDLVFEFARCVKEHCGYRVPVGQYSGYYFCMSFPAEGWHLLNDDVLDSPYIDFQITPSCYGNEFRKLGASGHARGLVDRYRLKNKLHIVEADTRTCLEPNNGHTYAKTDDESVQLMARDMAAALAHGCGLWYYDFGKVWYTLPQLKKYLSEDMKALGELQADYGSASEVAFIADFGSIPYSATEQRPSMVSYMPSAPIAREMGECGVPYDVLSFKDLTHPGVKDYKVYVFLNALYLDAQKIAVVDRLKSGGRTLVWLYAPGFLNERGHSVANISAVTGIDVRQVDGMAKPELKMDGRTLKTWVGINMYPVFAVQDGKATVHGTQATTEGDLPSFASKAMGDWTSVICTCAFLPRQAIQKICRDAGVHAYCDHDDAVIYANKSMVMLHTKAADQYSLTFTRPASWSMVFPERKDIPGIRQTLTFQAKAGTTYIFHCK